jgi:hypothetical protein
MTMNAGYVVGKSTVMNAAALVGLVIFNAKRQAAKRPPSLPFMGMSS